MTVVRPSWLRSAGMLLLILTAAFAVATPALAHNGTGGDSSDYQIRITGYTGDPSGIALRIIELGDRVKLTRSSAAVVYVLGYEGEQYLRLDADGVWENSNSPASYLNADRFAATQPPKSVTAESTPSWIQLSAGDTVRWHDHRAHYMSTTPPRAVTDHPDLAQIVHTDHIDMMIDGVPVSANTEVGWLPQPERLNWMITASALGALVTAGLVLQLSLRRLLPMLAIAAAVASMLGQGIARTQLIIGGVIVLTAVAGAFLRKPVVSTIAGVAAGALAAMRLEVFEHELLAGWIPGIWQRIVIVAGLGLGFGIAASALVTALSPTPAGALEESTDGQ